MNNKSRDGQAVLALQVGTYSLILVTVELDAVGRRTEATELIQPICDSRLRTNDNSTVSQASESLAAEPTSAYLGSDDEVWAGDATNMLEVTKKRDGLQCFSKTLHDECECEGGRLARVGSRQVRAVARMRTISSARIPLIPLS